MLPIPHSVATNVFVRAVAIYAFGILFFLLMCAMAPAATLYWDANGATAGTGGTGNWETTSSLWRAGSDTGTLGIWSNIGGDNDAILGGTAGTLTLTTGISVNDITVNPTSGTAYTIAGAAQTLTLAGTAQSAIDVASGDSLTITSGLAGLNGFTKSSAGTLIFDGAGGTNGLVGDITLNGGTLQAGSATNNGASQVLRSNAVHLAGGTTLTTVGTTIDLRVGSLSGSGSITPAVGGAINVLARSDATFSGTMTTTGGLNLRGSNGTTQIFNGNLTGLTGTYGINSGATLKLSGTGDSTSGVAGVTSIATRGGSFVMDNTSGNTSAAAGRVSNTATLSMLGGTISLIGNSAGTSETVGAITLNSGAATISVTNNGGTGTQLTITDTGSLRDSTSMTVNFEGIGGTLGSTGANPRITFSGTPFTGTGGLLSNTAGGATVGWATVNGSEWAGLGANGIVAVSPTLTASTNTTLQTSTSTSVTVFNPSANQTLSGAVAAGALKFAPTAGSLSLNIGTNSLTTFGVMLAGTNDFSITGTSGTLWGAGAGTRYVHVVDANTTLNVAVSFVGAQQPFNKAGAGFLNLNGAANQLNFTSVQNVNVLQGVMRGTTTTLGGGTSAGGAFTTLNLYGGVLEISGGGSFSRALNLAGAAGGGGLKWDGGGSARGDGGFSAIGGNATVTLVTTVGGATAAAPVWNAGGMVSNGYALVMGSTKADSRIDFTNNIGLDDGTATNSYFAREIRVADNTGSANDVARLSGIISGSANADLLKTGAGVLELTGTNTYSGNTLIQQGTLIATNGAAIANTSAVVLSNTPGVTFQLNNSETIGALSGGGSTGGDVVLQANNLTVGDQRDSTFSGVITGSGLLTKQGAGTLTLNSANTHSGGVTVTAGSLAVKNTTGSATGSGNVTVTGSTILGTGRVSPASGGSVIFGNAAILSVGDAGDTSGKRLIFTPASGTMSTTFQSGSVVEFDLFTGAGSGDNSGIGTAADALQWGGTLVLQSNVKLRVNNPNGMTTFAEGDTWKVLDWTTIAGSAPSGTFEASMLELPTLTGLIGWDTSNLYTAGTIGIIQVPEPSRAVLMLGGLMAAVVRRRR
jgi:fibronectin-binding autotransporter adhesin